MSIPKLLLPLLKQCGSLRTLKQIHAQILINSVSHPNHLLIAILRFRELSYALLHFSLHIPSPNDFSFNLLIRSLSSSSSSSHVRTCFSLFLRMLRLGGPHSPNSFTFPFVLPITSTPHHLHSLLLKSAYLSHPHTVHSLVTSYSANGRVSSARRLFDEITDKDVVSWNSMISGYLKAGMAENAVGLFRQFVTEQGAGKVEERMVASVVAACGDLGDLEIFQGDGGVCGGDRDGDDELVRGIGNGGYVWEVWGFNGGEESV